MTPRRDADDRVYLTRDLNWGQRDFRVGTGIDMLETLLLAGSLICGCDSSAPTNLRDGGTNPPVSQQKAAAPTITTSQAQNGAVIVALADATSEAKIHY